MDHTDCIGLAGELGPRGHVQLDRQEPGIGNEHGRSGGRLHGRGGRRHFDHWRPDARALEAVARKPLAHEIGVQAVSQGNSGNRCARLVAGCHDLPLELGTVSSAGSGVGVHSLTVSQK